MTLYLMVSMSASLRSCVWSPELVPGRSAQGRDKEMSTVSLLLKSRMGISS